MSDPRKEAVAMAFNLLDVTGDGLVNIDDIRTRYSAGSHPKVVSQEQTEEEVVQRFLGRFENNIADDGMVSCVSQAQHTNAGWLDQLVILIIYTSWYLKQYLCLNNI